jgi:hypothetical protein
MSVPAMRSRGAELVATVQRPARATRYRLRETAAAAPSGG